LDFGQTRSKGLPTDPRAQPAGGRDNGPPGGGWSLVDNKRNTHHKTLQMDPEQNPRAVRDFPFFVPPVVIYHTFWVVIDRKERL